MYVAEKYKDEKRFYVPWSFGYRGRVYPLVDTQLKTELLQQESKTI